MSIRLQTTEFTTKVHIKSRRIQNIVMFHCSFRSEIIFFSSRMILSPNEIIQDDNPQCRIEAFRVDLSLTKNYTLGDPFRVVESILNS